MTFSESVKTCFSQYANFSGRASASEYWWFVLFYVAIYGVVSGIGRVCDSMALMAIAGIFSLACLLPNLAVAVRRMHDIGKGGGWIFISLIPLIGWIWFLYLCCQPSEPGENRFGSNPNDYNNPDNYQY